MKKIRKIAVLLASVSLFVLLSVLLSLFAFAEETDYSKPGTTSKVTLDSKDILELSFGIELSDAENKYLSLYGEHKISYGAHIPASCVTLDYDAGSGELLVSADVYNYQTSNGDEVSWVPVCAIVGEDEKELIVDGDGKYKAFFESVFMSEVPEMSVVYNAVFPLSADFMNSLINKAYDEAVLWDSYEKYIVEKGEYDVAIDKYRQYLVDKSIFEEKKENYDEYLLALEKYESELEQYNDYLDKLAKYNEEYALYLKYLDDKEKYPERLEAYNIYVENLKTVERHLDLMEGMKTLGTSHQRSVYNAIRGNLVKMVMENKDLLSTDFVGVKEEVVDLADSATEKIKIMFEKYFSLETDAEKYTYYTVNYEELTKNFCDLFRALDKLYLNPKLRIEIKNQGYQTKFEIFLAQLYYVTDALSDSPVANYDGTGYYDSSYKIVRKTPLEVHENIPYMVNTGSAVPLNGGYPSVVEKPEEVKEVALPTKPSEVTCPIKPNAVEKPGEEPFEVQNPGEAPVAVDPPRALNADGSLPDGIYDILTAYRNGAITHREPLSSSAELSFEILVNKKIFGVVMVPVVFKDSDGTVLYETKVEYGTFADFSGIVPTKEETVSATYSFVGWQDENGVTVDITEIKADTPLTLYPMFAETKKSYQVAWDVDGVLHYTYCKYGDIPSYTGSVEKKESDRSYYEFVGWDREITSVTETTYLTPYVALFEEKHIASIYDCDGKVLGGAILEKKDGALIVDCKNSVINEPYSVLNIDLDGAFSRVGIGDRITVVADKFTVGFSYSNVVAMKNAGIVGFSFEMKENGTSYSFAPVLYDVEGEVVNGEFAMSVSFSASVFEDIKNTKISYNDGSANVDVIPVLNGDFVQIGMICGYLYKTVTEYGVNILNSDPIEIAVDKSFAAVGETVNVTFSAVPGIDILSFYLLDTEGNKTNFSGESFVMPAGGVSLGVEWKYIEYTVNFIASGKIISTGTYRYGDIVIPPSAPIKANDEKYSYTFVDWSEPISAVTKSVDYEAVYSKTELPPKEVPEGLLISKSVMKKLMQVALIAGFAVVVVIPCAIIALVKLVVRSRRRTPSPKKNRRKKGDTGL